MLKIVLKNYCNAIQEFIIYFLYECYKIYNGFRLKFYIIGLFISIPYLFLTKKEQKISPSLYIILLTHIPQIKKKKGKKMCMLYVIDITIIEYYIINFVIIFFTYASMNIIMLLIEFFRFSFKLRELSFRFFFFYLKILYFLIN